MLHKRQCSECDNSNSNSEPETVDPNAPRKLRYGARDQSLSDSQDIGNDVSISMWIFIYLTSWVRLWEHEE